MIHEYETILYPVERFKKKISSHRRLSPAAAWHIRTSRGTEIASLAATATTPWRDSDSHRAMTSRIAPSASASSSPRDAPLAPNRLLVRLISQFLTLVKKIYTYFFIWLSKKFFKSECLTFQSFFNRFFDKHAYLLYFAIIIIVYNIYS